MKWREEKEHRDQMLTYHATRNEGKRGQLQKQKICRKTLEAISIDDLIKNMNIEQATTLISPDNCRPGRQMLAWTYACLYFKLSNHHGVKGLPQWEDDIQKKISELIVSRQEREKNLN